MTDGLFGARLRELLAERGMSQNELARRSQYNPGYLSKVISGRKAASEPLARRLDELLGAGGELAALAAVPAAPRLTAARRLEIMSGQIEALRAEVSALTEVVTFALLGISPAGAAPAAMQEQSPEEK